VYSLHLFCVAANGVIINKNITVIII